MNDVTSAEQTDYTARARLFGGNRMKLGVMAFNCSHGSTITTVPEAWKLNWADTVDIAQAVDRARGQNDDLRSDRLALSVHRDLGAGDALAIRLNQQPFDPSIGAKLDVRMRQSFVDAATFGVHHAASGVRKCIPGRLRALKPLFEIQAQRQGKRA